MQAKIFKQVSKGEMANVANEILQHFATNKIFLLKGDLGAGKTTLTQEFCKLLNCVDAAASPTYSIINEYKTQNGLSVFHLDLYRIKNETEALQAGVEDIFFSGNYCFVEWFEVARNLLPDNCILIELEKTAIDKRRIIAQYF